MIDKHLHLSGATNPCTLFELIKENGFKTKSSTYWEFAESVQMDKSKVDSLDKYLEVLHLIDDAQSYPRAIERCFYEAYRDSYLHGATELQLRWNPVKRSQDQKIDLDSLIVAARAGGERAKNYFGITGSMILCMGRDVSDAANAALFNKAVKYHNKGIIGIDVAGSETKPLNKEFKHYYQFASSIEMERTIHVGETFHDKTEEELRFVIEELKPNRIGHGIQIVKFPELARLAAKAGIEFEICITSNLTTKAVESLDDYATIMRKFEEFGLRWTVCTDATHTIGTNIRRENDLMGQIIDIANGRNNVYV
jgi:adenosine deaminase